MHLIEGSHIQHFVLVDMSVIWRRVWDKCSLHDVWSWFCFTYVTCLYSSCMLFISWVLYYLILSVTDGTMHSEAITKQH